MKHVDGVRVQLYQVLKHDPQQPLRQSIRISEYDNGGINEPRSSFNGSLGIRQVAVAPGTHVEVTVTLDKSFKLYSADGVWIEISSGSKIGSLELSDSGQCWWLDGQDAHFVGEHKFSFLTTWAQDSLKSLKRTDDLTMPGPDADNANTSYDWIPKQGITSRPSPNKCNLVVFVGRGKRGGGSLWARRSASRVLTEPPRAMRFSQTEGPKVIRSNRFCRLRKAGGRSCIFEFRNMGVGRIDPMQQEAEESFGKETVIIASENIDIYGINNSGDGETPNEIWDEGEDENMNNSAPEHNGKRNFKSLEHRGMNGASIDSYGKDLLVRGMPPTKKRAAAARAASPSFETPAITPRRQRSKMVKLSASCPGRHKGGKQVDEDDSEDLPTPVKRKGIVGRHSNRPQQSTPASTQSALVPGISADRNLLPFTTGNTNTWRGQRIGTIAFGENEGRRKAGTTSGPKPTAQNAPDGAHKDRNVIDLTDDGDDGVNQIKQESANAPAAERQSLPSTTTATLEDEDGENLEYRLQEIQVEKEYRLQRIQIEKDYELQKIRIRSNK